MRHRSPLHLLRSVVVTAVIVALAVAGHVFGGGDLPMPVVTLALASILLAPVTWLSRRQLSFVALLCMLGTGQLILHEAFSALSVRVMCQPVASGGIWHHQAGSSGLHCRPAGLAGFDAHGGAGGHSFMMLAGHVLAVLVIAWFLRQGEAALWQLAAWLRPLVFRLRPTLSIRPGRRVLFRDPVFIPTPWRNLRLHSRRGPPGPVRARPY